jgi:beta-mannosidase
MDSSSPPHRSITRRNFLATSAAATAALWAGGALIPLEGLSGHGTVEWRITNLQGNSLDTGRLDAAIPARASEQIKTLDLASLCQQHGKNNIMAWLKLTVDGRQVSQNLVTFGRPKELNLDDPKLRTSIVQTKTGFRVTVAADKPAMWVWLGLADMDARYSDNFVHLNSRDFVELEVIPTSLMTTAEFEKALTMRSLYDTYSQAS